MSTLEKLWPKLRQSKRYRAAFIKSHAKREIGFQIRELLKQHDISQQEVAKRGGIDQSSVSRAADGDNESITLRTLTSIAAGLDVAFVGRFVPFSEYGKWFDRLAEEEFAVQTFDEENAEQERIAEELLARAEADDKKVTQMEDFILRRLKAGQRKPPKPANPPEEQSKRGATFDPSRGGPLLPSAGTNESVP